MLDELFSNARLHTTPAQYASHSLPFQVFLLEEQKEVIRSRMQIETLLNIHKSDKPESGREPVSQNTIPGFVDPGIRLDDNPNTDKREE